MTDSDFIFDAMVDAAAPDPPYTVSEWADLNRVLSSKSSAEPGKWRTARTPYLREIMDCLSSYSPIREVNFMKGVQIGASESGFNFVGYVIEHAPGPMMYVLPTIDLVKKFSKTRIDPMITASPSLSEKIRPARARDSGNTIFEKDFDGGILVLVGANSGSGLRGTPVRYLVLDEVDGYPHSADDDGDPVTLATDRTRAHTARRKIFRLSTPLLKETSRIGPAFREGDQRYYHVRCQKCGTAQPISWSRIKWEVDSDGLVVRDSVAFVCDAADPETGEVCDHRHYEHNKEALIAEENGAAWVPTAMAKKANVRSYHLSALYSPWYPWADIVERFLNDKQDPAKLQTFVNNVLGEEWEDLQGDKLDPDSLLAKREDFAGVPERVAALTCGVDVQPDRLELEVVGWGRDEESWSVDYQVIPGDPSDLEVWDQLDDYLQQRFNHPKIAGGLKILATCIDTGGANTQDAYRFVRPREGRRIWGIKGKEGSRPVWPKKPTRNNKGRINLYIVGVDTAKEVVTARLTKTGAHVSGPGACHFPLDRDKDYFEQMTAETKVTRFVKGFKVVSWQKPDHARNEAFDCRVYAYAALQGLVLGGFHLNRVAKRLEPANDEEAETVAPAPKAPEPEASQAAPMTPPARNGIKAKKKRGAVSSPFMR